MTSTIVSGVDAAVTGYWRTYKALGESDPESSPEEPDRFKKMRSSTSLNSLRMSLRKRLPLRSVQSNVNVAENPTWESLQMNQKTSAVRQLARTAKNSIGSAYQKFQRSLESQEECLVNTPGRLTEEGENEVTGTACTPQRRSTRLVAVASSVTPKRVARAATKKTPRGGRTPEASDSAVRAVRTGGSRRQLVRMAALRSPFASPNTLNQRRQFDRDLDHVSSGLRKLKRLSQAFDDIIGRDERDQAMEHYKEVVARGYCSTQNHLSGRFTRASLRRPTRCLRQTVGNLTDAALSTIRKAP